MNSNLFLRRRSGRYEYRRRVPAKLRDIFGRAELVISLGPVRHADAVLIARSLAADTDRIIRIVSSALTKDEAIQLAQTWYSELAAKLVNQDESVFSRSAESVEAKLAITNTRLNELRQKAAQKDYSDVLEPTTTTLQKWGGSVEPDQSALALLAPFMHRALMAGFEFVQARLGGNFGYRSSDPLFTNIEPGGPSSEKLSNVFDTYVSEKSNGEWRPQQAQRAKTVLRMIIGVLGDRPLSSYTRHDFATKLVDALHQIPKTHGKSGKDKDKPVSDLIACGRSLPPEQRLSKSTVSNYMILIGGFLNWCVTKGFLKENPARGSFKKPPKGRASKTRRVPWDSSQIKTLLTSPVYRGRKSKFYFRQPGNQVFKDELYWIPVLALYHPVRLEELCQLRTADIIEEENVIAFHIFEDTKQSDEGYIHRKVKSEAGHRKIPIHQLILDLGFSKYVEDRRKLGKEMVFDLKPGGVDKRYGAYFTKQFGTLRKSLGIEGVDFHGLRHTVIDAMRVAGIQPDIMDLLEGHASNSQRTDYGMVLTLAHLKEQIDKISYPGISLETFCNQPTKTTPDAEQTASIDDGNDHLVSDY